MEDRIKIGDHGWWAVGTDGNHGAFLDQATYIGRTGCSSVKATIRGHSHISYASLKTLIGANSFGGAAGTAVSYEDKDLHRKNHGDRSHHNERGKKKQKKNHGREVHSHSLLSYIIISCRLRAYFTCKQ